MDDVTPYRISAYVLPAHETTSADRRVGPCIAPKSRAKITVPKQSEKRSAMRPVTSASAKPAKPSPELIAKGGSSRRASGVATEEELAVLCQRRASLWANAIREGLDPDIAQFVRSQAAAWQLLATCHPVRGRRLS
jgi:hypothetical protein